MTTADKLAPFASMLDTLDDTALAAAAGVTVEEAAAFRAGGAVKPADEKPKKGGKAKATTAVPEAPSEPKEAPAAEVVPESVRVTLKRQATVTDTRGARPMPWRLSPRDVYSGEQAAYLWEHHREIVEAFPTKG